MVCYSCFVFRLEQVSKKKASLFARQRRRPCKWQVTLRQRSLKLEKGFANQKFKINCGEHHCNQGLILNEPLWKNPSFEAVWLWNRSEMMSWRSVESSAPMRSWSEGMYPRRRDMFSRHVNASPMMFTVRPKKWMLLSSCFASLHVSLLHLNHSCPHWLGLRNKSRAVMELAAACDSCVKNGIIPNFRNSLPCLLDFQTSTEFCKCIKLMQP